MTNEEKVGVYICTGCQIGESIDIEKLNKVASEEYKIPLCKTHPFLCSEEGVNQIKNDIGKEGINRVVIAACSPRENIANFYLDAPTILERANLREQVAWCHKPNDEDTQMLAEDNLRMSIVKARKTTPLEPFIADNLSKDILVVGGGIAGLSAAIEAAKAGSQVTLVEKSDKLGGWANKLYKQSPKKAPWAEPQPVAIDTLIHEAEHHSNITVYTSTIIEKTAGEPGLFEVTLKTPSDSLTLNIGAIVLAIGWQPYDASKLGHLGYGKLKNVVTSLQMEELAFQNNILKPSDGSEAKSIAFIQCAGSRDQEHLPYCSSVCCLTTLKQAKYVSEKNPEALSYIIYKDIRTPSQNEIFYKSVQEDPNIFLTKGEIESVEAGENDKVIITVNNTLLGEKIKLKVDLLVLAVGMTPADSSVLKLTYRLGEGLPELKYGFPDSHFICFPYESRRTGIYVAGGARAPMHMGESREDGTGAALKAIQCVEAVQIGAAVHPRYGDLSYPDLALQRCTQCKRCTEECPFGTYDEDEKGTPLPHPNRCRRCGICLGACPERIINFNNFSIEAIGQMIKAVEIPDEFEEKPRVLALVCENDAYPAFDLAGQHRIEYSPFLRIIPVRCLGTINKVWIADALSKGFDGILLIGCKAGDDYQCHFIQGSEITSTRGENIQETLTKLALEQERVTTHLLEINDFYKLPEIINEYMENIDTIGLNPFKGL